jgi:2-haloacid dehalogenase
MLHSTVKAVLFDVFGTVVDWRSGVARETKIFLERYAPSQIDPAAFADAWRGRYTPSMEPVRTGRRPFTRLDVLHLENLLSTLSAFGLDPEDIPEDDITTLNASWHRLDPWPDAVAGLTRLKTRYIVAPLSNGNVSLMIDMAKRAGIPWDAILGAELVQTYKPAPEAYLRTADILGLAPEQICLVAAHNSDLAAARACGYRTAFIPRLEHGPTQTSDLTPEQDWDIVASDFGVLAGKLGV